MKREPLFVRFANGDANGFDVIQTVLSDIDDKQSKEIATGILDNVPDTAVFRKDFRNMLTDLTENGVTQQLRNYVNSYMKPSLTEYVEGSSGSRAGEKRTIVIKESDTPWIEAVVCYNLCLYIKMYGVKEIKQCPICTKFFSNKGKYAKYCSDTCKSQGRGK